MDVLVDGQSNFELKGDPDDLMAVMGAVVEHLRGENRAIVGVVIDGEDVPHETLQAFSEQHPVDSLGKLEVTSRPVAELVGEALDELDASVPELATACHKLSEIFHGEAPQEGFEPFHALAEIWGAVKQREGMIANMLNIDLNTLSAGDTRLESLHTELNGFLEEAAQAIIEGDCVLLGDLLEYELAPRAEKETQIVALLRKKAAAVAS